MSTHQARRCGAAGSRSSARLRMDRSGWIDAKTHRRDGACSASVSSDSSASEVLVLISIAQTSPSQLQAQNSSKNIICWRGDLRPKSPLFPSATLHCSSLSLFVSLQRSVFLNTTSVSHERSNKFLVGRYPYLNSTFLVKKVGRYPYLCCASC